MDIQHHGDEDDAHPRSHRTSPKRRGGALPDPVVVALSSKRTLLHDGFRGVCARFAPWITMGNVVDDSSVDVILVDLTGSSADDIATLTVLRRRYVGAAIVFLLDTDGAVPPDIVADDDFVVGVDVNHRDLVRALLDAASRPTSSITERRHADWFGQSAGLTRRQSQCAVLCAGGLTNQEIAERMFVNVETVKSHLQQAYRVLGVRHRAELAAIVFREEL